MIHSILSNDLAYALAWTLIHSVWQISLVAIILAFVHRAMSKSSAAHRYATALGFMAVCVIMSMISFASYYMQESGPLLASISSEATLIATGNTVSASAIGIVESLENYFPLILNIWLIGAGLFLLKMLGAFIYMKNLASSGIVEKGPLQSILKKLNKKFAINRLISIKESARIATPMVIGYLKPVILFPIGLVNNLSTSEIECIIAHELAHVKRHDFILNLFQMVTESLFYYHPGIWFISSCINSERENCCDDMAIACCGSNISYARTLVKLQELRQVDLPRAAFALSGRSNSFKDRILRILNQGSISTQYRDKLVAIFIIFASFIFGAGSVSGKSDNVEIMNPEFYIIEELPSIERLPNFLDTIPEKKTYHITKVTDSSSIEMKMEDGDIVKLKIDGKEIDKKDYDKHKSVIDDLKPNEERELITIMSDDQMTKLDILLHDSIKYKVIRLDSIISNIEMPDLKLKMEAFEHDPKFSYRFFMDSINNSEYEFFSDNIKIELDSILELIPDKMPEIYFHPGKEKLKERIAIEMRQQEEVLQDMKKELEKNVIILRGEKDKMKDEKFRIILEEQKKLHEHHEGKHLKKMFEKELYEIKHKKKGLDHEYEILLNELGDEGIKIHLDDELIDVRNVLRSKDNKNHFFYKTGSNNVSDKIMSTLLSDGLIDADTGAEIELTGKFLKINGDKQAENIWKKYKKIYEDQTGIELTRKSKLKFELDPEEKNKDFHYFEIRK